MKKRRIRVLLDIALTLLLGIQMAYSLVGELSHEITGLCMIALLVLHHMMNGGFHRRLFTGRYTPYRIVLTLIDAAMLTIFLTQGISGLMMAKHIRALNSDGANWARQAHLVGAYWGFVLCGVHAGLHMTGLCRKWTRLDNKVVKWTAAFGLIAVSVYGATVFVHHKLWDYMTLRQQFVFFDFSQPLERFFLDYLFTLVLFVMVGCLLGSILQNMTRRSNDRRKT